MRSSSWKVFAGNHVSGSGLLKTVSISKLGRLIRVVVCLAVFATASFSASGAIWYVKQGATGSGTSWTDSSGDLQAMINGANAGDEIWVAAGTYFPNRPANNLTNIDPTNRNNAFVLKSNVKIYGGFAGAVTETILSQRDIKTNKTILSGNIGHIDDFSDNCYHVVISAGDVGDARLDGFTITGGYLNDEDKDIAVNGLTIFKTNGAGIYNASSSPSYANDSIAGNDTPTHAYSNTGYGGGMYNSKSNPKLTDVIFCSNSAYFGGGIANVGSTPELTNVVIKDNKSYNMGGGIYNASTSPAILTNVVISGNIASTGGGIYNNNSNPVLTNVPIKGNITTSNGGGIYNTGSSPTLTNALISGNHGNIGGGMYNTSSSSPVLTNVTVAGNSATNLSGIGINNAGGTPLFKNCIVWGNTNNGAVTNPGSSTNIYTAATLVYSYCLIEGLNPTGGSNIGNLNGTPVGLNVPNFKAPLYAGINEAITSGDFSLTSCSPCIDKGYNDHNNIIGTDIEGNARISNTTIDMGAYEYQGIRPKPADANGIIYVKKGNTGGDGSGDSWTNALPELADAMMAAKNTNTGIKQIWVAAGTYYPLYYAAAISCADGGRDNAFVLVKDLKIYGGFAGAETILSQRDIKTNKTILSGDINTPDVMTDNCYHVVISAGDVGTALLDGFSVIKGYADGGTTTLSVNGQGIIKANGGGIYVLASSPKLVNLSVSGNQAVIYGSTATTGLGGGIYQEKATDTLTNVLVSGNVAQQGGGIYNLVNANPLPVMTNMTIAGNNANGNGQGLYSNAATKLSNSIVWGNGTSPLINTTNVLNENIYSISAGTTYTNCLIEGYNSATGSIKIDVYILTRTNAPNFIDPRPANEAPTVAGDYSLTKCSPCINQGDNDIYKTNRNISGFTDETELGGKSRLNGSSIDIGAYEFHDVHYAPDASGIMYVNKDNTGGDDSGSSWTNAVTELAEALMAARNNTGIKEIWVAKGTYNPKYHVAAISCVDGGRDNAFVLVKDVKIYGGFSGAGTENNINQRDIKAYETILSGEIGAPGYDDNCGRIVMSIGDVGKALLDGFTITGAGGGSTAVEINGANQAGNGGGGVTNYKSSPAYVNIVIKGNMTATVSTGFGGGMYNNNSSPTLTNVLISGNYGYNGGGIYNVSTSSPVLTNVTIAGNAANTASGIGIYNSGNNSNPILNNCIVWGNTNGATTAGAETNINTNSGNNKPVYSHSLVEGLTLTVTNDLGGNISSSLTGLNIPNFRNPQYATGTIPNSGGDYRLDACSPCIDRGFNDHNNIIPTDIDSNPRIYNSIIDMGAYEYQGNRPKPDAKGIMYVKKGNTGGDGSGNSWTNALPELAYALMIAKNPNIGIKEIWVAKGTYNPEYHAAAISCVDGGLYNSFVLVKDVKVYGGFEGVSEISISERDTKNNETVLSGNIGDLNVDTDNCYHVVMSVGDAGDALLDGFTVTAGAAGGTVSITVNGVTTSQLCGAGVYNLNSSPAYVNVAIRGNRTVNSGSNFGGGMYNNNSSPKLTNVLISGNFAYTGGGMYNVTSTTATPSTPVLTNVTVAGNAATATSGIGIYNNSANPTLNNCIVWGNTNGSATPGTSTNISGNSYYSHSLVEGVTPTGTYDLGGNIVSLLVGTNVPSFKAPLYAAVGAPNSGGDYSLDACSPCIDKGDNGVNSTDTDIDSNPRIYNTIIDMGAYEFHGNLPKPADANGIIYVKKGYTGGNGSGDSWTNALPELSKALIAAKNTNTGIKEIWVAAGTYYPLYHASAISCVDGERNNSFVLVKDVKVYGGFAGSENNISERDIKNNETILSGNIGDINLDTDNSYHVVMSVGDAGDALLDGFTVTGGYANGNIITSVNGTDTKQNSGGGVYNLKSSPSYVNVAIKENQTYNSSASNLGGGMYNDGASPKLTNVIISGNYGYHGGGMYNVNISSPVLTNVLISGNLAYAGGGMYNVANTTTPVLTNVTVAGNAATTTSTGIGIYNNNGNPKLYNCIVWGNNNINSGTITPVASTNISGGSPVYSHSLIEGVTPSGTYDLGGNISSTLVGTNIPNFKAPLYATASPFAPNTGGDYSLDACSPCIDKGDNGVNNTSTDIDGNPRKYNNIIIDMGAYEYQGNLSKPDANGIMYVKKGNTGGDGSGDSWTNALPELANALMAAKNTNTGIQQIWVAEGTYNPLYHASAISCADGGRNNSFVLVKDVKVYGGFAGSENNISERDIKNNETILSGNIGDINLYTDNCYHVVMSVGDAGDALLDGFTVTAGYSNGTAVNISVNGTNTKQNSGAGVYNLNSSPAYVNVAIKGNQTHNTSSLYLGGGMYNDESSPKLTNVLISGNVAHTGGGMYNTTHYAPVLTNVTVAGNAATSTTGIGIYNSSSENPTLYNCIVWGNTNNGAVTPGANTNISSGITPVYSYCLIQGLNLTGDGNLNGALAGNDPQFISLQPATVGNPTSAGDYRIPKCSIGIDRGDNTAPNMGTNDLDGGTRIVGAAVDLGAYEYQTAKLLTNGIMYVNKNVVGGDGSGDKWENAVKELSDALVEARYDAGIKQIWVAKATYYPLYGATAISCNDGGRDNAFVLVKDVQIYGGFAGYETQISERNMSDNPTILSGDIKMNGTDRVYHVVISAGVAGDARLDGFTVTGGNADGADIISVNKQSITRAFGGGVYIATSSPTLVNLIVNGNKTIKSEILPSGKYSGLGGGMYIFDSNPVITNVLVSGNTSYSGAGMYFHTSSPVITNVTVSGNAAVYDGWGIHNYHSSPKFYNSIIWGHGTGSGNENSFDNVASPEFYYSIVQGKDLTGSGFGNYDGTSALNDPKFKAPIATTVDNPVAGGDFSLKSSSLAINTGDNKSYLANMNILDFTDEPDITGRARLMDTNIERGAYEYLPLIMIAVNDTVSTVEPSVEIYVKVNDNYDSDECEPAISVDIPPTNGNYTVEPDKITYSPQAGFEGVDSLDYHLVCGMSNSNTARVYILVVNPLSPKFIACPGATVTLGFSTSSPDIVFNWYDVPFGGMITNPATSTITVPKTGTATESWWVEPVVKGIVFPRIRIDLEAGGTMTAMSDIRIDVCPSPSRMIHLTSFIEMPDSPGLQVNWTKINSAANIIDASQGTINSSDFAANRNQSFRYEVSSTCGVASAIAYVHTLTDKVSRRFDTITICKNHASAENISITGLFGVEASGVWLYDHLSLDAHVQEISTVPFTGAVIFNGKTAYNDASIGFTPYHGDTSAKQFVFTYKTDTAGCLNGEMYSVVVVVGN